MTTVRDILDRKGAQVWAVDPESSVQDALLLMKEKNIGAVFVIQGQHILGVFSERDYVRQVANAKSLVLQTPIRDLMTSPVLFIRPEQSLADCMDVMTARRLRHLPVLDDENRCIGVLSIGDVVREVMAERESTIKSLENYILGHQMME
jgi:CBS domain-containing protein